MLAFVEILVTLLSQFPYPRCHMLRRIPLWMVFRRKRARRSSKRGHQGILPQFLSNRFFDEPASFTFARLGIDRFYQFFGQDYVSSH